MTSDNANHACIDWCFKNDSPSNHRVSVKHQIRSLKHFFSTYPSRLGIYLCKIPTSCDHTENFDSVN